MENIMYLLDGFSTIMDWQCIVLCLCGILGGMSDGSTIVLRAAFKPTPSISQPQKTVNRQGEEVETVIKGRHDPIIVPRAVVVVETMAAFTVADLLLQNTTSRLSWVQDVVDKMRG